jgi:ribonucleotide reductase beta subunit family protein with ferritin-like domain
MAASIVTDPVPPTNPSTTFIEPILKPDENRYVTFPIQHSDAWDLYKRAIDSFWHVGELNLAQDLKDWEKLTEPEQHFIKMVLAFFSSADGVVTDNLGARFMNEVQISEARQFYAFQIAVEAIHSETYSLLIDTYIRDAEEKDKLFKAVENYPCINKKFGWAQKWLNDKRSSFATRLVAFAIVEGIFFSSSFAAIYWIKKRGLMPGLTFSNELISRDEALHTEFAVLLYNKLQKRLPKKKIHDIIKEAVEIEKEFITEAIPCRMIGMNAKLMTEYIEFVADRLAVQLGYDKVFNSQNPFDFMELISIESKVNFFERTNSEYALANKTIDCDVFEFNAAF